jgi:glycosyltransferase involved in cell wall biosynthesis
VTLQGRRIIFVLGNLQLGGAERQALILAKHLVERERARVEIWGFNQSGPVAETCERLGLPSRVVPYDSSPSSFRRFAQQLRSARPDVLLPYTWMPNVVCGLVWRWTGARLCVWNQRDEGLFLPTTKCEWRAVQRTPRFIANSRAGAWFLIEKLKVDAARVRVVQNGIDLLTPQSDRGAWRGRLEIAPDSFVACMVANLHANKDHATLLKAWRIVMMALEQSGCTAVLVLAGRPYGAYEALVALTRELGIESGVRFAGAVSDVAGLLSAVDIGVFSSRSEGCPNGVLECMAAGLAVAATDIDGVREVIGPSGHELLAPPGDADGLARIILKLAHDRLLCSGIGADNRERVEEMYTAERMCAETVAMLF